MRDKVLLVVAATCILILVVPSGLAESMGGALAQKSEPSALSTLGVGALVGASFGAFVAHWLSEKAEKRREDREQHGLLLLLYTEACQNKTNIDYVYFELNQIQTTGVLAMRGQYVKAEAWKAVRVDLAKSLSHKHFAALADYYKNILLLEEVVILERSRKDRNPDHETNSDMKQKANHLLKLLKTQGGEVIELIQDQVPDDLTPATVTPS